MAIDTDSSSFDGRAFSVLAVRPFLGAILVARGLIAQAELDEALEEAAASGERLGDVLVRRGSIFEQELAQALALQYGLDYVDLSSIPADPRAAAALDPDLGLCTPPRPPPPNDADPRSSSVTLRPFEPRPREPRPGSDPGRGP